MMKKTLFAILFNILLIVFFVVFVEFIIYKVSLKEYREYYGDKVSLFPPPTFFQSYKIDFSPQVIQYYTKGKLLQIRPFAVNEKNVKPSLLLFGCSFTHGGMSLEDKQTVGFKLEELTKRNVFSFGMCGCGIQHMLFVIQHYLDKFIGHDILDEPEYAIYFYIPNQLQRLQINIFPLIFFNGTMLHYNFKNDKLELEQKRFPFLYKSFIIKGLYSFYDTRTEAESTKYKYNNFMLANELFLKSREELQKRYPNIKFVIVRYMCDEDESQREVPFMWDVLKSEGFEVINSEDLVGRKFLYNTEDAGPDGYHPSEKAWDLLLPPLIEKLEL